MGMLYSLLTVAGSLSMTFGDDGNDNELVDRLMSNGYSNVPNGYERTYLRDPYERTYSMANGYDRTYHSDPYKRTYSNVPRGYERTYSNVPRGYERTYSNVPGYERTYSNDGHYPSQHDKYPPMKPHDPKYPSPHNTPKPTVWKSEKTQNHLRGKRKRHQNRPLGNHQRQKRHQNQPKLRRLQNPRSGKPKSQQRLKKHQSQHGRRHPNQQRRKRPQSRQFGKLRRLQSQLGIKWKKP